MNPRFFFRLDQGVLPPPGGPVKTRLAVRAIIERGGLLLLVHSLKGGDWKFPGGGVQSLETPEEALAREVAEETGYDTLGRFQLAGKAVERSPGRDVPGSRFEMESRYYFAQVTPEPGKPRLEDYERELGLVSRWASAAQALEANRALLSRGKGPPWLEREIRVLEVLAAGI